jgi:hypothetical protein
MVTRNVTAHDMYRAAQSPVGWLLSAQRLRDAADAILEHEVQFEIPYFQAYDHAAKEALAIACSEGNDAGSCEICAQAPNYPPAQVLYAYAIENVLKGLIVSNEPALMNGNNLSKALRSHDLIALANAANFQIHVQEKTVLEALSQLSVWAGRYPVALHQHEYIAAPNPDELMDYGSRHPIMKAVFKRAHQQLEQKLPNSISNRFGAVVVFRPLGT